MFDERQVMLAAYKVAAEYSTDLSTQNSALLIHPHTGKTLCGAVNSIPTFLEKPERFERPLKYKYTPHAEHSAIMMAARAGIKTVGLVMFAPWAACQACAMTIVLAGIKQVWTHQLADAHNQWNDDVKMGIETLRESGVEIHVILGQLDESGETKIRRNYELISV